MSLMCRDVDFQRTHSLYSCYTYINDSSALGAQKEAILQIQVKFHDPDHVVEEVGEVEDAGPGKHN